MSVNYLDSITIPVTNPMPLQELQPYLVRFMAQGLLFGISKKWGKYEIWRSPLTGETPKNCRGNMPGQIIETDKRILGKRDFVQVYQSGALVWEKPRKKKRPNEIKDLRKYFAGECTECGVVTGIAIGPENNQYNNRQVEAECFFCKCSVLFKESSRDFYFSLIEDEEKNHE